MDFPSEQRRNFVCSLSIDPLTTIPFQRHVMPIQATLIQAMPNDSTLCSSVPSIPPPQPGQQQMSNCSPPHRLLFCLVVPLSIMPSFSKIPHRRQQLLLLSHRSIPSMHPPIYLAISYLHRRVPLLPVRSFILVNHPSSFHCCPASSSVGM